MLHQKFATPWHRVAHQKMEDKAILKWKSHPLILEASFHCFFAEVGWLHTCTSNEPEYPPLNCSCSSKMLTHQRSEGGHHLHLPHKIQKAKKKNLRIISMSWSATKVVPSASCGLTEGVSSAQPSFWLGLYKLHGPNYLVILLKWTPIFEWYTPRLVVRNEHHEDMSYNEIGLCVRNTLASEVQSKMFSTLSKTVQTLFKPCTAHKNFGLAG